METKLPELMQQATHIVDFESTMAKPSILADYNQAKEESNAQQKPMYDEEEEDDEIATMDNFIAKAGRRLIRKDLLAGLGHITEKNILHKVEVDEDGDEIDYVDPNSHIELFKKPELVSKGQYMDIVARQKPLNYDENFTFTSMNMQQRKNKLRIANPMSISLPNLNAPSSSLHTFGFGTSELASSSSKSTTQKPFKLPKAITGAKMKKLSYSLHRTPGFDKTILNQYKK